MKNHSSGTVKLLAIFLLLAVFSWIPSQSSAAPVYRDANFYGISAERQETGPTLDPFYKMYEAAGATYVEKWLSWGYVQPNSTTTLDDSNPLWSRMNAFVQSAQTYNLKLVPFIQNGPKWAVASQYSNIVNDDPSSKYFYGKYPPDNYLFYNFVFAAVNRYKPGGSFSSQLGDGTYGVTHYQCGTEFNVQENWQGNLSEYVEYLKTCRNAVKSACPTCTVLSGTIADGGNPSYPTSNVYSNQLQPVWYGVRDLYQEIKSGLHGSKNPDDYFDILNFHTFQFKFFAQGGLYADQLRPYPLGDSRWYTVTITNVINEMNNTNNFALDPVTGNRYSDADKKIWISETGYPSAYTEPLLCDRNPDGTLRTDNDIVIWGTGGSGWNWSEQKQSELLNMVYQTVSAYFQVETVMWWSGFDRDRVCNSDPWPGYSGLIRPDMTAKPSYRKFGELTGKLSQFNETSNNMYYFPWYDNASSGMTDWLVIANAGTATANVSVYVNEKLEGANIILPNSNWSFTSPGLIGGPVKVVSTNNQPLVVSQRVIYNNTFNELSAVPFSQLSTTYVFPWYDNASSGMTDWLVIANAGTATANVAVYLGSQFGPYSNIANYSIAPGRVIAPTFPGRTGGPLKAVSTNGQPLVVSQRVLYNGKFNETMGIPSQQLSNVYIFPWYDATAGMSDWIIIGNDSTATANVSIYWANNSTTPLASTSIAPGGYWTPSFPGWMAGPVTVISNQRIVASQRVLYNGSFNEVTGVSFPQQVSTAYYFPWYDNNASWGMKGDWVMIGNPSSNQTATVNVKIGSLSYNYTIGPWQVKSVVAPANTTTGPVTVTGNIPIYASQRVIYYNSFNETMGMPLQ